MSKIRVFFWTLSCFFIISITKSNAQEPISKDILIKNVELYITLNYQQFYSLYDESNIEKTDSLFAVVDSNYFCLKYIPEPDAYPKTIYCLYYGENSQVYSMIYGDINNDGYVDAIVTFTLEGFYGGNGWGRFHAVFISDKFGGTIKSVHYYYPFIEFDEIKKGILYGFQYGHDVNDSRNFPSLKRDVIYNYESGKLNLIKEFEYKKIDSGVH